MVASKVHHGAVLGELTARSDPLGLRATAGGGAVATGSLKRAPWSTLDWRQIVALVVPVVLTGVVTS